MKSYDWLKDVSYDYDVLIVYVRFNPHDYEEKLGIKHGHLVDKNCFGNSLDYFKVDKVLVIIHTDDSIIIKSEKEADVNKVLEYIDKIVSL